MLVPVGLNDLVTLSDEVVEGQLSFIESRKASNGHIYSYYQLEVFKSYKGLNNNILIIKTFGGNLGLELSVSYPSDELQDQIGIFFLIKKGEYYELTATAQGKIWINNQKVIDVFGRYQSYEQINRLIKDITKEERIFKSLPTKEQSKNTKRLTPTISSISPTHLSAGTDSIVTIKGFNFNSTQGSGFVEFSDANSGGNSFISPLASQYLYWDDTMIRLKFPTRSGTGVFRVTNSDPITTTSTFNINVPFNLINVTFNPGTGNRQYTTPLQGLNSGNSMLFSYNTRFFDSTKARLDLKNALEKWRCSTLVHFDTLSTTTSTDVTSNNLENVIAWDFNNTLSLGVLGTAYSNYSGCLSGGIVTWFARDLDVIFNDVPFTGYTWEYGPGTPSSSQFDFESVALHELGHSHQLGHVIDATQTMHYSIANGQRKNTISRNDSLGGVDLVNRSLSSICGNNAMTALTNSNCSYLALSLDEIQLHVYKIQNLYQINWSVINEFQIEQYEVQVSFNGIDFKDVHTIKSNQNQQFLQLYQFEEERISKHQLIYYRIAAVENGIKKYFSNIVEIKNEVPFSDVFFVNNSDLNQIQTHFDMKLIKQIKIFNQIGQNIDFQQVNNTITLENNHQGVYFIQFEIQNNLIVQKIILE